MSSKVENKLQEIINSDLVPQEKLDNITDYIAYLKEHSEEVQDYKITHTNLSNHRDYLAVAWTDNSGNINLVGAEV